jgi:ABC-2 type transport system ATP-binding protein
MNKVVIKVKNVKKHFLLPHEKSTTLKGSFLNLIKGKRNKTTERQKALKDISFEVKKGEFFGIVGRNGSGKSTLLKMLAGIYQPSSGDIYVDGRLVPFIELGVGFNGELTGRENVYLNGSLLGFSKKEIDERYDDIVSFAELEKFMDQKLKNYSSGMQVRLAFSLAIQTDTDILLVDEVLAVGDADFQRKCFDYFRKLKREKKTVVFVSHDMSSVREYCDKAILIEKGEIIKSGDANYIATEYAKLFFDTQNNQSSQEKDSKRWGDGIVKYTKVRAESDNDLIKLSLNAVAKANISNPNFGFTIRDTAGRNILGTNSHIKSRRIGLLHKGERVSIEWELPNILNDGKYYVDPAVVHENNEVCDWWEEACVFEIKKTERTAHLVNPQINLRLEVEKKP